MIKIGKIRSGLNQLLIVLLLLIFPQWAMAKVQVTATVDADEVGLGEVFNYVISVSTDGSTSMREPRLPNLQGVELLGQHTSDEHRMVFNNGAFQSTKTKKFIYQLKASRKGAVDLKPATVVVGGKNYRTNRIRLKVGTTGRRARPRRRGLDPFGDDDDLFSQLLKKRAEQFGFKSQPGNPKEAFFIQVEVDKKRAFVGEQVTASWYLYTRGQISDIDTLKYPSLKGFWKEDIEIATRLNFTNEVVNGIIYRKALLASYALFPIKAGEVTVDSYKAKCTVITPSNLGFSRPYNFTKASRPVKIKVLDLPAVGRPENFNGAVGEFNVQTKVDSQSIPVNQPVTYRIRFEGSGNAKLIDLPSLELPPTVELYDTKKESKFFKNGTSYKEFEVLLIPREQGAVTIPSFKVAMFNPGLEKYYVKSTPEIKLTIVAGKGQSEIPDSPLSMQREDKKEEKAHVLPLPEFQYEEREHLSAQHRVLIWSGLWCIVIIYLLFLSRYELGWGKRKKNLHLQLKSRLSRVYKALDKQSWESVGAEATNTIYWLLGEVSGVGGSHQELDKMLLKIPPSVRKEIEGPLKKIMNYFEVIGFAPEELSGPLKNKKMVKEQVLHLEKILSRTVRISTNSLKSESASSSELT